MKAFPHSKEDQDLYFIAEIGSNHNQDLKRLKEMINTAVNCGFDAIKLQYYQADKLWSSEFPERIEAAKRGQIDEPFIAEAKLICNQVGIALGCSVFNKDDVKVIAKYLDFIKISSYECMNFSLINECRKTNLPLFISTGMCSRTEIYSIAKMANMKKEDVLFHCVSFYPVTIENVRIDILKSTNQSFSHNTTIGYSDHTCREGAVMAAINAGARIIELHYDLMDMQGAETKHGHVWNQEEAEGVIFNAIQMMFCNSYKMDWFDNFSSREDRKDIGLRADNSDGMRPQLKERNK